ncbi:hypothetical protein TorRG33x02_326100, partial [Trema orientale]
MASPPNPPPLPPRPPFPLPVPAASSEGSVQQDQLGEILAMMRSLQQEVTALKNREGIHNGNSSLGSQAAPTAQAGTSDAMIAPAAPHTPVAPSNVISTPGVSREYFTKDEILEMMRTGSTDKDLKKIDFRPPYPSHILSKPYPKDYINPRFRTFDGRTGNAKKHVVGFIDDLGVYAGDEELRIREFSKSLTGRAYDWFVDLPANSIKNWQD